MKEMEEINLNKVYGLVISDCFQNDNRDILYVLYSRRLYICRFISKKLCHILYSMFLGGVMFKI